MLSLLLGRLAGVALTIAASGSAAVPDLARASQSVPACFAAAARDPGHPCSNPQLRTTVVPTPIEARTQRNSPCATLEKRGLLFVCGFGAPPAQATATIALIGDSHAAHWRAALDVVGHANGWAGISLSHTGCPLSQATKNLPQPRRDECVRWNREVHAVARSAPRDHDRLRLADLRRRRRHRARPQPARGPARRLPRGLAGAATVGRADRRAAGHAEGARRHRHVRAAGDRAPPAHRHRVPRPAPRRLDRGLGRDRGPRAALGARDGRRPHALLLRSLAGAIR